MRYVLTPPPWDVFACLRADLGWGQLSEAEARAALNGSLADVTALAGDEVVGFGRVVGDGVLYHYLQDIVVAPGWQGHGVGRAIVGRLLSEIRERAISGSTIGLMSAKGAEDFYTQFGFRARPDGRLGAGMTLTV